MSLGPLPYHEELAALLEAEMPRVWEWFSSHRVRREQMESARLDLLKTTYRLEPGGATSVYAAARRAAEALGLEAPITVYQSQRMSELNASLVPIPEEAHVVLHGPVTEVLTDDELLALFGHELAHARLWSGWDERFLIAHEILAALANDPSAQPAHFESGRLYALYTEVFCDRGSLLACGELHTAITALVKMQTGLKQVDPAGYLRQADEILAAGEAQANGESHPESYLRARALDSWAANAADADESLRRLIEGRPSLDRLDLLGQRRVSVLTRRLLDAILAPEWMRTDAVLGHARLFFDDYTPPVTPESDEALAVECAGLDDSLRDYVCYLLLDFCTSDADLEEAPLAAAIRLAERLGLRERFEPLVCAEMNLRKKQFDTVRRDAAEILARAGESRVEAS